MDTNKLIGLGILGIGGYLIYSQFRKGEAENLAVEAAAYVPDPIGIQDAAAVYAEAGRSWSEVLAGEPIPGGRLYRPLDISAGNPLRLYYAVVKPRQIAPYSPGFGTTGGIYLFNPETKRETALDQLAKSESMTEDARAGVEDTFAHAFLEACKQAAASRSTLPMNQWFWKTNIPSPTCQEWASKLSL